MERDQILGINYLFSSILVLAECLFFNVLPPNYEEVTNFFGS